MYLKVIGVCRVLKHQFLIKGAWTSSEKKKKAKQISRLATNSTWYSCTSNAITPRNFVVCSDGLHQIPALIIMQSTLSKTDTFGTGTSCPSYRKSIEGAKKGRDQL